MANLPDLFRSDFFRGNRSLFSDLFREFDDMFNSGINLLNRPLLRSEAMEDWIQRPMGEVEETDSEYLLSFDVPGVSQEDLKIDINQNVLTVSGERKQRVKEEGVRGRRYGRFQRSIMLPQGVDPDQIRAHYEAGVLEIVIPKTEEGRAHSIQIEAGRASASTSARQVQGSQQEVAGRGSAQQGKSAQQEKTQRH